MLLIPDIDKYLACVIVKETWQLKIQEQWQPLSSRKSSNKNINFAAYHKNINVL